MKTRPCPSTKISDTQRNHWESNFLKNHNMFGEDPSYPAQKALTLFKKEGKKKILELGGGQGRDSLCFARAGLQVYVLDYAESGLGAIRRSAEKLGLSPLLTPICHDVRNPLPFRSETFDACYSHMLYCMALTTQDLQFLSSEIRRVLKPGGINVYTVRHTGDSDYRKGIHRGEDMYEVNGFIVHFFSREKIENLAEGYEIVEIEELEEGKLPRKLFAVTLRKKP